MGRCRTRAAAIAAALAFGMAGCGGASGGPSVALQAADDGPGVDGKDGEDGTSRGGDGGDGRDATPTVDEAFAKAPEKLRACLTRNDEVVPWRDGDVTESTGWHKQGRQSAHVRIMRALEKRLGIVEDSLAEVRAGFLGYDLDPVGNRLIMQVDPDLIHIVEFRRWVSGVADRANESARVRGPELTVTVQKGCFSARQVAAIIAFPREHTERNGMQSLSSKVQLDGRVHAWFADEAGALATQRKFGAVLAAHYPNGPAYRFYL